MAPRLDELFRGRWLVGRGAGDVSGRVEVGGARPPAPTRAAGWTPASTSCALRCLRAAEDLLPARPVRAGRHAARALAHELRGGWRVGGAGNGNGCIEGRGG